MSEPGDDESARSLLVDCLRRPQRGKRRLPAVVGLLEADDERTRLAAAWVCCLVAVEHPDAVEYVVRRLSDRLTGEEVTLELTHALDYLADRYPDQVESVLADLSTEASETADDRSVPFPEIGGFTRAHYYTSHGPARGGVGRVRFPDAAGAEDPRRAYTSGEPDEREMAQHRQETREAADSTAEGHAGRGDGHPGPESGDERSETAARDDADGGLSSDADPLVGRESTVSTIAAESRFDDLHVLARRDRGRYAVDYRALVGRGSEEEAVALRVLRRPDDPRGQPAFEDRIGEHLRRWADVDDHDGVLTLLDWDVEPRPWLATAHSGRSLADRGLDSDRPLGDAIALADAVAHGHRNDVVHAGIDPGNVTYPGDALDGDRDPPLLNNVGLLSVYRYHADPTTVLDPRFAAPEYYDRQFGRVDAATDVYQLGAVVFALATGQPPHTGSFESVRDAVTGSKTPVPGDVVPDVPPALDEAVAKAMATRKLTRYEAVEHFQQDLLAVEDGDPS